MWTGGTVLFSGNPSDSIREYDPATGDCAVIESKTGGANGLRFGPSGHLYACEDDARRVTRYERDGTRTVVIDDYDGDPLNSPNDLAFDGDGRLWFTDPCYGSDDDCVLGHRSVYRVGPTGPE